MKKKVTKKPVSKKKVVKKTVTNTPSRTIKNASLKDWQEAVAKAFNAPSGLILLAYKNEKGDMTGGEFIKNMGHIEMLEIVSKMVSNCMKS